jgi:hypothetical protein
MALKHPTNANDSKIQLTALFSSSSSADNEFAFSHYASVLIRCDDDKAPADGVIHMSFKTLLRHSVTQNRSEASRGKALD